MRNQLQRHPSHWPWWYALLGLAALLVGSMATVLLPLGAEGADGAATLVVQAWMPALTFVLFSVLALLFLRWASGRWPTVHDLALKPTISRRELGLVLAIFLACQALFWLLGRDGAPQDVPRMFQEYGLAGGLTTVLPSALTAVILAPVCEELLYRGIILRSVHDGMARHARRLRFAALVAILASGWLFAMPHLAEGVFGRIGIAYLLTGFALGLVYVLTGSLTAAMVAHALQSAATFGQILLLGNGGHAVALPVHGLVFGAPLWVFLCARGLYAVLPKSDTGSRSVD